MLYGKPSTEKALWQGKPLSKGNGTQALIQGRSHAKNSHGPLAWQGLDEETTKPGKEGDTTYSPARGGGV